MSGESRSEVVVGPNGEPISADTLPPSDTDRWVPRRKAEVVYAIRGGLLSREEACRRYSISSAELFSWERLLDEHGMWALRVTRTQQYPDASAPADEGTERC